MYSVLVISHGPMAENIIKTSEMILGKQEELFSLSLSPGEGKESFENKMESFLEKNKEKEILVLADLYGGTPFNSTIPQMLKNKYKLGFLTGVNLPMVIEALLNKDTSIENAINSIKKASLEGIQNVVEVLGNCDDE